MRIAIVTDFYYPSLGGITEHVDGQARALTALGHEVSVITGHLFTSPPIADAEERVPDPTFEIIRMGVAIPLYVPHWGNNGPFPIDIAKRDGVIGLANIAVLALLADKNKRLPVLAGITGACLPDTDKLGEYFAGRSPWPKRFDEFHKWIQREAPHRIPHEVTAGAAMFTLAVVLLRRG